MMHSYVYLGGKYLGNGFALTEAQMRPARLTAKLQAAGARLECSRDCDSLAPTEERAKLAQMLRQPLVMLGWAGCPCTNIARSRFESVGACYLQQVWPTDTAPLYKHLLAAPLKPCTQSNDGSTTGWARTGSCNWDPS